MNLPSTLSVHTNGPLMSIEEVNRLKYISAAVKRCRQRISAIRHRSAGLSERASPRLNITFSSTQFVGNAWATAGLDGYYSSTYCFDKSHAMKVCRWVYCIRWDDGNVRGLTFCCTNTMPLQTHSLLFIDEITRSRGWDLCSVPKIGVKHRYQLAGRYLWFREKSALKITNRSRSA